MSPSTSGLKRGLVAAAAVGALLLAGCSDDSGDASKGDTSSETTAKKGESTTTAANEQAGGSDSASETTTKDAGSKTPAPKRNPSVKGFCDSLTAVANQQAGEQDYVALQATAPDEISSVVNTLAETAKEATSTEQPSAELQERGIRSVVGVTIYAIDECPDASGLIEAIGIDKKGVEVLKKYSIKDVQDDAKWKKIFAEIQQG